MAKPTEKSLSRRLRKVLDDALALAREMGAADPRIYVECDNVYIMDGPSHDENSRGLQSARQHAVVLDLGSHPAMDCGAW